MLHPLISGLTKPAEMNAEGWQDICPVHGAQPQAAATCKTGQRSASEHRCSGDRLSLLTTRKWSALGAVVTGEFALTVLKAPLFIH